MRLIDLAVAIGMDAESCKKIQICHPGRNWEDYDEFNAGSELLKPFYDLKVKSLSAVNTDVIRVLVPTRKNLLIVSMNSRQLLTRTKLLAN